MRSPSENPEHTGSQQAKSRTLTGGTQANRAKWRDANLDGDMLLGKGTTACERQFHREGGASLGMVGRGDPAPVHSHDPGGDG